MSESSDRLDRIEAMIAELAINDRRLQERHEALAQSLELLKSLHDDNERRIGQLMDSMNRLVNIVISHEQRLDDLENR
jgi:hypothetical protein